MGGDEEIGFDVSRPATLHNGGAKLAQVSSASLESPTRRIKLAA